MNHVARVCVASCGAGAWIALHAAINGAVGWGQAVTYVAAFLLAVYV